MPEGFLVGFKVALQDGRSVWVTQDALDLKGEGSTFLADWHDWPEVARLQEATQEAIDLIRSKFGGDDENPSLVELARCVKEISEKAGDLKRSTSPLVRTVFFSDETSFGLHYPGTLEDNWIDKGTGVGEPDGVALIHSYVRPLVAAAGAPPGRQLIRLTTCAALRQTERLMRLVFPASGAQVPAVLGVDDDEVNHFHRLWTEICVGSDVDGTVTWEPRMTDEALETAPLTLRDAVKAARKLQLLTSLQGCVQGKGGWIGGVLALSVSTRPYLSEQGRAALDGLVARLSAALEQRALSSSSPVYLSCVGERLEAQGEYLKAADVYRRVLDINFAAEGDHRLACPPLIYGYLGLALKRAGRFADAVRDYEAGLAYLADTSKPVGCDHPAWRETVRIYLFDLYVKAVMTADDEAAEREGTARSAAAPRQQFSLLKRLFRKQAKFLSSTGDSEVAVKVDAIRSRGTPPTPQPA